jgi:hypothetical protein
MTKSKTVQADFGLGKGSMNFRLIYRSKSLLPKVDYHSELGAIFRVARVNNVAKGITGALLRYDDWFVQALEGLEPDIRKLFHKIEKDPRHNAVEVIDIGVAGERVFSRWAMAEIAEHGETDIPLIATRHGIAEAATRTTTNDQERVLDIMRGATRGYGRGY